MIKKIILLLVVCAAGIANIYGANLSDGSAKMSQLRIGDAVYRFVPPGATVMDRANTYPLLQRQLHLDLGRPATGVDAVLPYDGHAQDIISYTGKGVVIGVVDTGFEPMHIAFMDRNNQKQSRVVRYVVLEGAAETEGGELVAYEYTTPEEIASAPIYTFAEGHGTHVAGTAAGAWMGNGFYGVAPDAELVMVSLGESLYDDEILYGIDYSLNYGRKVGKPVVVNLSLGSQYGPHDGTGYVSDYMQDVPEEGNIVVFSAGNDSGSYTSFDVDFLQQEMLGSCLSKRFYWCPAEQVGMQIWSDDNRSFEIRLTIVDCKTHEILYRTPEISIDAMGDELKEGIWLVNSKEENLYGELGQFFKGELMITGGIQEQNGRYAIELVGEFDDVGQDYPYMLGFEVTSRQQAHIIALSEISYCYFTYYHRPEYKTGTDIHCISDFCTSPYVVSVGSWNSRDRYTDLKGEQHLLENTGFGEFNDVGKYSSHGTVIGTGERLPHVLAPGTMLVAPYNTRWVREQKGEATIAHQERVNGKKYYWGEMTGTSMASPMTTGTIALWLEAKPDLTRDQVLEIMANSSVNDDYTIAKPDRSGYGKLDAYQGIKYIHNHWGSTVDNIQLDKALKPCLRILSETEAECVLPSGYDNGVAEIFALDGALLQRISFSSNIFTIPRNPGLQILRISSGGSSCTLKY